MHPADDINYCFKGISMLIFVALQFRCAPTSLYLKETPNRISDARSHCSFLFSLRATTLSTVELVRSETFFPPHVDSCGVDGDAQYTQWVFVF